MCNQNGKTKCTGKLFFKPTTPKIPYTVQSNVRHVNENIKSKIFQSSYVSSLL